MDRLDHDKKGNGWPTKEEEREQQEQQEVVIVRGERENVLGKKYD